MSKKCKKIQLKIHFYDKILNFDLNHSHNSKYSHNKCRVGLSDVEKIAESVVSKLKSSDKSRNIKDDIIKNQMKHKLGDAIKCTVTEGVEYQQAELEQGSKKRYICQE